MSDTIQSTPLENNKREGRYLKRMKVICCIPLSLLGIYYNITQIDLRVVGGIKESMLLMSCLILVLIEVRHWISTT